MNELENNLKQLHQQHQQTERSAKSLGRWQALAWVSVVIGAIVLILIGGR